MKISRFCPLVALLWMMHVPDAAAQCSYSVSPTSFSVESTASSRTISVVTGTQCSWTATSPVSWIRIVSGAAGSGIGSVTVAIEQNATASPRTITLSVAGTTVTITQGAGSCASSVTPASFAVDASATSRTVSITTGTQCAWTATSTAAWITVTNGGTGSGVGLVTFTIAANPSTARTGTLNVAGHAVTVTQGAGSSGTVPAPPTNLRIIGSGTTP
jgi:hypothetical protein